MKDWHHTKEEHKQEVLIRIFNLLETQNLQIDTQSIEI